MIDRERLVADFLELVQIDSPSGEEDAIAANLVDRFTSLGAEVAQDAHGNVVGRIPGSGTPLLLSAHMDTVEPGHGVKPIVEGEVIRTDGTTVLGADDKAGCAVILEVIRSLAESDNPHRPVEVAITRGEEIGLVGARHLDPKAFKAKVALVLDDGAPPWSIQSAAPWAYWYTVDVHGRSAHAGLEPEKGIPAISIAAEVIAGLPQGRLDSETTGNVGKIVGGQVVNAVPDHCRIEGEFRSMSQAKVLGIQDRISDRIDEARANHPEARIEVDFELTIPGFELAKGDPARDLIYQVLEELGMTPDPHPVGGGTDGNILRGHGISSVVIGAGGRDQHTKSETLVIPDMVDCARVVERACRS